MTRPVLAALLSVKGPNLSDEEKKLFARANPIGITLFNRNLVDPLQTAELIKEVKETIGRDDVIIAADQEGGRVNRLKAIGFGNYASAQTLGTINTPEIIKLHSRLIANDMRLIGANMNFAPVLDVEYPQTTAALKSRCYGNNEQQIATLGKYACQQYIQDGICPCIKHMPGHGRAVSDPHLGLPIINSSIKQMAKDFYPFQQLQNCPAGMTAHILLPQIDNLNPITLSAKGIREVIRGQIGFKGFLISDAIEMGALKGTILERARTAWQAGCDAVCYCSGRIDEMTALCREAKFLDGAALERFERIKQVIGKNKSVINLDNERKTYYSVVKQFAEEKINYDATEVLHQMEKGER